MMKAKNIFKTLAFAMLMSAMLLTFSCSNITDDEITDKNGYTLPVTVNVTRQGDESTTKATYNDNGNQTGYLSFSEGDQLFVTGRDNSTGGAGQFAGLLTWQSAGTFTGTIYTKNAYSGTANELFTSADNADDVSATLIPCNYTEYNYINISNLNSYKTSVTYNLNKAYAFSKAEAVEQLSKESTGLYNNGFALTPKNAILNLTITGLKPNAKANVKVGNTHGNLINVDLNSNPSGTLQIAIGFSNTVADDLSKLTLTVNGTAINLGSHELVAGHIYNVARSPLSNAFVNGNETVVSFTASNKNLTLSATYNNGSFGTVTRGGTMFNEVNASMERDGNDLKIGVTIMRVKADIHGDMTIDTVNNTYRWSNNEVGDMLTLSSITIGGNNITPLPTLVQ